MNGIDEYAARGGRIISHYQQLVIGDLAITRSGACAPRNRHVYAR
jgi:hypothetical protein